MGTKIWNYHRDRNCLARRRVLFVPAACTAPSTAPCIAPLVHLALNLALQLALHLKLHLALCLAVHLALQQHLLQFGQPHLSLSRLAIHSFWPLISNIACPCALFPKCETLSRVSKSYQAV